MRNSYQIVSNKHNTEPQQQTKRKIISSNTVRHTYNNLSLSRSSPHQQKNLNRQVIYECAFHKEQIITNFCKNKECLLPLCPKCVSVHCQDHCKRQTFADFAPIDELITQIQSKLSNTLPQIQSLEIMITNRKRLLEYEMTDLQEKLTYWKQTIIQFVVKSFNNFQQSITQIWNLQTQEQKNLITQYEHLTKYITEYSNSCLNKFNNPSLLLQSVIQYFLHLDEIISTTSLFQNFRQVRQQKPFNLNFNENYLEQLQQKLIQAFLPNEEQQAFNQIVKQSNRDNLQIHKLKFKRSNEKEKIRNERDSKMKKQRINLDNFRSPLEQFIYPVARNRCKK